MCSRYHFGMPSASKVYIFRMLFSMFFLSDIFIDLCTKLMQDSVRKFDVFNKCSSNSPPRALPERSWNMSASPARFLIDLALIRAPKSMHFNEYVCRLWVSYCHEIHFSHNLISHWFLNAFVLVLLKRTRIVASISSPCRIYFCPVHTFFSD